MLTERDHAAFAAKGYHIAHGLLTEDEILPLLRGIDRMLCAKAPGLQPTDGAELFHAVHDKILFLKQHDRRTLAAVYDAIRKLLPFWSIVGSDKMGTVVRELLGTDDVG